MKLSTRRFLRINLYTIIAVYFLILVGGIVRSMGAGMGCPDWPKCFGSYIPPSSASELPDDYERFYAEKRLSKNLRFSKLLSKLGFHDLAKKVQSDNQAKERTYFDVGKAWVEYINRLIGVVIGLFIILNMVFSFASDSMSVKALGVASFILVLFQGWIGSLVVSTNLLPGFISFHMSLALLLVCFLLYQRHKSREATSLTLKGRNLIGIILVLFGIQILFGTQVREQIDQLHIAGYTKSEWINQLDLMFYIHRSYSLLILALIAILLFLNREVVWKSGALLALIITVGLEILLGAIMAYFSFPSAAQPLHLLIGTLSFGLLFYLFLRSNLKPIIN
jgi:cytochrome c oxidase assembly protein subunit 15